MSGIRPDTDQADGPAFGAILLAGGRASRVGGAAKPLFEVGGQTLLARAVAAVARRRRTADRRGRARRSTHRSTCTGSWRTRPSAVPSPGSSPRSAAQTLWTPEPEWTFVLACDLPRVDAAVARLSSDILLLPTDTEGVCLADASSRPQWLTGAYRTAALRTAAAARFPMPDGTLLCACCSTTSRSPRSPRPTT